MKIMMVLLIMLSFVEPAYAVYKCNIDGKIIYQQSPCPNANSDAQEEMKIIDSGKTTGLKKGTVSIGMDRDTVIWSWGEPYKINDSYVAGHKHEQWIYNDGSSGSRYLYFEDGKLTSWQNTR